MKQCLKCNQEIKNRTVIDGKVINSQRRKYCYGCSPFGSGNNQLIKFGNTKQDIEKIKHKRTAKKNINCYKSQKKLRKERKQKLVELLGGKCSRCGYDRCVRALDFHHKDRLNKIFNLSNLGYTCSWDRLVEEVKKCELVCSNCHREIEDELVK